MGFWTAVVVITAIVAFTITSVSKHKHNSNQNKTNTDALEQELAELKARVQTLEKIVTEPGYNLKQQFKDLEDEKTA